MGPHGTHHPGPCASAMGPALTSALGHARTMWGQGGCAGASPRLAGCRPPSADVIGKVARPRALPQRYVCPPLCAVTPPPALPVHSPLQHCAVSPSPLLPAPLAVLTALLLRAPLASWHPDLPYLSPRFQGTLPASPTGDCSLSSLQTSRGLALTLHQLHHSRLLPSPPVLLPRGCQALLLAQHRRKLRPCGAVSAGAARMLPAQPWDAPRESLVLPGHRQRSLT